MNTGRLAGTGKFVILPVDQGFEHGPARSFASNPPAYNPLYHYQFAIEAGCNAYAAPLGFLEAGAREFAGEIPLILKVNDHELLGGDEKDPDQAITGSVEDALRIGAAAVGFTIYPGSANARKMYGQIEEIGKEAKRNGLAVVIWSYPRGSALSKEGETAIDVCGYAAHIAAQLGANIIKVKIPTALSRTGSGEEDLREGARFPSARLPSGLRTWCSARSTGGGSSFFPAARHEPDDKLLEQVRGIQAGGGFGSIIGRNSFTRKKEDALKLLGTIMDIYEGK